mmetsp:Transcript_8427/g.15875  ORF Transcript_8427/g.15875 Transcript_8427/m.15875 type:complete len:374 (+) Transcript_8427:132-1253(+)
MEEDEAQRYGFKLSRVVSLTSLLDELKSKDSETFESKKSLEAWANKSIEEATSFQDETASTTADTIRTTKKNKASLNFATASFAISFLKARQAKLAEKKYNEAEKYKNNDVLPSRIPVDIYLESLRALKGQKEHRKVDLFKELRKKKAIQRRDESFKKTISRLKHRSEDGPHNSDKKLKNTAKITRKMSSTMLRRASKSEALFDQDCMPPSPRTKHTANQHAGNHHRGNQASESWRRHGEYIEGTVKQKEPTPSPYCAPFGNPVTSRPSSSSATRTKTKTRTTTRMKTGNETGARTTGKGGNAVAGAGCSPVAASGGDDYNRQMEATLSTMMNEHDKLVRGDVAAGVEGPVTTPFGAPLGSRPLCGIYSQHTT